MHPRSRLLFFSVMALIAVALGSAAQRPAGRAAEAASPAASPAAPPEASRPVGPTGVVLPAAEPMATEMQREIERGQREYAALFRRLATAPDEREALAIEQDMRQQRVELQIVLLRIQAAYARRAGRNAFADQLERAIPLLIAADPPRPAGPDGQRRL